MDFLSTGHSAKSLFSSTLDFGKYFPTFAKPLTCLHSNRVKEREFNFFFFLTMHRFAVGEVCRLIVRPRLTSDHGLRVDGQKLNRKEMSNILQDMSNLH